MGRAEKAAQLGKARRVPIRGRARFSVTYALPALEEVPDIPKSQEEAALIKSSLQSMWMFQRMNEENVNEIVLKFKKAKYTEGQNIINEGDEGNIFYVIASGKCTVSVGGVVKPFQLGAGDHFGELALFYETKRSATVTAVGEV